MHLQIVSQECSFPQSLQLQQKFLYLLECWHEARFKLGIQIHNYVICKHQKKFKLLSSKVIGERTFIAKQNNWFQVLFFLEKNSSCDVRKVMWHSFVVKQFVCIFYLQEPPQNVNEIFWFMLLNETSATVKHRLSAIFQHTPYP